MGAGPPHAETATGVPTGFEGNSGVLPENRAILGVVRCLSERVDDGQRTTADGIPSLLIVGGATYSSPWRGVCARASTST